MDVVLIAVSIGLGLAVLLLLLLLGFLLGWLLRNFYMSTTNPSLLPLPQEEEEEEEEERHHRRHDLQAAPPTPTSSSSSPVPRLTLRLGLPGSESSDRNWDCCEDVAAVLSLGTLPATSSASVSAKRAFPDPAHAPTLSRLATTSKLPPAAPPATKAQLVGWPPMWSYRKNTLAASASKSKVPAEEAASRGGPMYVKVSMDAAPYLRKVDIKMYSSYKDLSMALEKMFSCFITVFA
ncbi:unnamed protein product [Miscanthus lutarioriparius]|uniref:Auxin-responsive protein n=1 Tax=Miscanthus lutarioriparius TaxID=422564 RepID=A0A811MH79_9POAL|nr:unnamed protein product [Miscanthus lutarioriparius]